MSCLLKAFCLLVIGVSPLFGAELDLTEKVEATEEMPLDLGWLDLEELAQIKVSTVARKEVEVGKTAAAVHVITAEDIRRSGATSIPEILRLAPGVEVARIDSRRYAISIRGLNDEFANKLLALQDGRSLYTPIFGGVFWDQHDTALDDIERIEVVRGPGGTAWGANAVNGVINIITKPAEDTQGTLFKAGAGTFERGFGMMRHGGKINDFSWYRFYVKAFLRDETKMLTGTRGRDDYGQMRTGFRIDSLPSDRTRITLLGGAFYQDANQSLVVAPDSTTTYGGHFLAKAQHAIDDVSDATLQMYYDGSRIDSTTLDGGVHQFDIDGQYRRELTDRMELNVGLNYRYLMVPIDASPGFLTFSEMNRDLSLFGAFADLEYALVPDRLKVSGGLKGQYNEFSGWDPLPNVRLIWTPADSYSVWAAYSQGISTPTAVQHDVTVTSPGAVPPTIVNPNTGLDSEKLRAYEIGYRVRPTPTVSLDLAGFYNEYDDLVSVDVTGFVPPIPLQYMNLREGEVYGVELAAVWNPMPRWRLSGTYTAQKVDLRNKPGGNATNTQQAEEGSPEQQVRINSAWDVTADIELDASLRYVDSVNTSSGAVADYFSMDLRAAWRPREGLELSIVGRNLLENHRLEYRNSFQTPAGGQVARGVYAQIKSTF